MSHRVCLIAGIVFAAAWSNGSAATDNPEPFHVGESERLIHPNHPRNWRGALTQGLRTTVWYPISLDIPETAHDIGIPGQPIFHGHPFAIDAALSNTRERFPLLLMSHGTGGSAGSLDWLASALAASGYVVVGVNHPGNNSLEPLTREGFKLWWERATDVSDALDGILEDPALGRRIDRQRIGAVGFSLGGYTVMELAGARTRVQRLEDFCASPAADAICDPPEKRGIKNVALALSAETAASVTRGGDSYRDPRIRAVFAIAPALGEAFDRESFHDVHIPIAFLGGSADSTVPVDTNIRRYASFLPEAGIVLLPGASHYTFLDQCVTPAPDGMAFACQDNPGVDRNVIHALTIERVRDFFSEVLHVNAS